MPLDDEIYFKVAADLSDLKPQFQDLSKFWDKHNADVAKGEKAIRDYSSTTEKAYQKVNQKIKENISQVANEGKAMEQLEKKIVNISKKNEEAFDSKEVKEFQKVIKSLGSDMSSLENLNLSVNDIDILTKKLGETKDDFEALNVIVDFFEAKMKGAAVRSADSVEILNQKIDETRLNIANAEKYIKDIDNQIDDTAPGRVQAGLIEEREAAKRALLEENVALEDYKNQLKSVRSENIALTTQLARVKDEMIKLELEGQRGSDRYEELKTKAEEYRKVLKTTNDELTRSVSDTKGLDQIIGAATGLVGAFTAAQGAAALFGDESEDLAKALVKITGAIALLNGLQAVGTELSKKDALTTKALAFVKGQYAVATNTAATATARFAAALKLTGIGLIIGAIAAAVVYWEDIKKAIKGSTDELDRNNEINKRASDLMGEQVAKMRILVGSIDKQNLSLIEQEKAVKDYNEEFGKTFGVVKDFQELQDKLIASGPAYIKYLELKARGEAAYQIALEKTQLLHQQIRALESGETLSFYGDLQNMSAEIDKFFGKNVGNESISPDKIYELIGLDPDAFSKEIKSFSQRIQTDLRTLYDINKDKEKDLDIQGNALKELEKLSEEFGISVEEDNEKVNNSYQKLSDTLQDLIKKQRDLKTQLISNDREREKQILEDQLNDEKAAYAEKIKNLKGSEQEKLAIIQEFNKIYNEETGTAYEQLRANLKAIDDKYNAELEKVKLNALQAIDEVFLSDEERQRKAIKKKFDNYRDDLWKQIDQTNDELEKQKLARIVFDVYEAEDKVTKDFDSETANKRLEREREIAKSVLEILKTNNKDILNLEKLHTLELLMVDETFYKSKLDLLKESFEDLNKQGLFSSLVDELGKAKFIEEIEAVRQKLIEAFGEETAAEIIKTVEALKQVQGEVVKTKEAIDDKGIGDKISESFSSFEGFFKNLGTLIGLSGEKLKDFVVVFGTLSASLYDSIKEYTDLEVQERQRKVDALEESISGVENEMEREKELYDQGYANNYEARQQDLEALKAQKREEEKELQRALKRKAAMQKAEFLIQTAAQFGDLVTASTKLFSSSVSLFGPFGVPVAIAAIATMFAGFAAAKVKAFQAIGQSTSSPTYRTGLQKGRVHLSGPSHEEGGYGVHDSRTGNKVAEVENNEDLYVLNPQQQRAYNHLLDMMIADSRGQSDLETSLRNHYNFPKTGQHTLQVVERVNTIMLKSQDAKAVASKENQSLVKELRDFKETFKNEFEGYKREREDEVKSWETPEYFHVKKGPLTKNYPKKKSE